MEHEFSQQIFEKFSYIKVGRVAQSVQWLTTGLTVRRSKPGGARFSTRLDRPWGPPSFLYNEYSAFPGIKYGRGVLLTTHPLIVARSWKSRAIPLPTLWAITGPVTRTLYLYSYTKFHGNPSGGNRVVECGRTDRHDEANSRFLEFCLRA